MTQTTADDGVVIGSASNWRVSHDPRFGFAVEFYHHDEPNYWRVWAWLETEEAALACCRARSREVNALGRFPAVGPAR